MNTADRSIAIQIKKAPLAPNIRYLWIEPYLIVPLESDESYVKDVIRRFEEKAGVPVNSEV